MISAGFALLIIKRKTLDKRVLYLLPLLLLCLLVEGARSFLPYESKLTTLLFAIYTPVEFALLSLMYVSIVEAKASKIIMLATVPLFITFSLFVQKSNPNYFYKYLDVLVECPLMLVWTLFYFFQLFTDDSHEQFRTNPFFWISIGNILFFTGSFFSYGFGSYLFNLHEDNLAGAIFWIERCFNLLLYSFYITGIVCSNPRRLSLSL